MSNAKDIAPGDWATVRRVVDAARVAAGKREMCDAFERMTKGHTTVSDVVRAVRDAPRRVVRWRSRSGAGGWLLADEHLAIAVRGLADVLNVRVPAEHTAPEIVALIRLALERHG